MNTPVKKHKFKKVHQVSGWRLFLIWPVTLCLRLWSLTLRIRINAKDKAIMAAYKKPALFLLWHNRLFCTHIVYKRLCPKRKIAGLVSASKDGGWLAALFQTFNIKAIRGSSSFRGSQSIKEMLQALTQGYNLAITPDGPRGPCYSVAPGALLLAEKTQAPIILISWSYSNAWQLKSWDKFYIPLPFSKIHVKLTFFENYTCLLSAASGTLPNEYIYHTLQQLSG